MASARKGGARKKAGAETSRSRSARGKSNGKPARRRDEEVMAAAVTVFNEHGYADSSVQDVADELGILKGSLYHYIDTKEDLLYQVLLGLHVDVEKILEEIATEEDLTPVQRLETYVSRQVKFNLANLPRVSIYYNDVERLSPPREKDIISRRKVHERYVRGLIEEAQERGEADASLDSEILTNSIFGSMIWTYKWYRPGGRISAEKLAVTLVRFVLAGIGAQPV